MLSSENHANPEIQAQLLMQKITSDGNLQGLDGFLSSQIDPGQLRHVLEQLKARGNEAFERGRYSESIQFYDQALAGTKDVENQSVLLSNKSAALMGLALYEEALEAARKAIQLRPSWCKGWYRAGRVLYEMKSYTKALKILNVALMKDQSNKEIQSWIKKTDPLSMKEKALERVTVDYTRFEHIKDDDEDQKSLSAGQQQNGESTSVLEFKDDVPEDERNRLTKLLTGQSPDTTLSSNMKLPPRPVFNPQLMYERESSENELTDILLIKAHDATQKKMKMKHQVKIGILNLLQLQSEVTTPKQVAHHQLRSSRSSGYRQLQSLIACLRTLLRQQLMDSLSSVSMFFLGVGTSIPLLTAMKTCHDASQDSSSGWNSRNTPKFTVCINHRYPFLGWLCTRMFDINDMEAQRENATIICKPIGDVTVKRMVQDDDSSVSAIDGTDSLLDTELLDLPNYQLATTLVIDPEIFDGVGIGKGALHDIRDARRRFVVACKDKGLTVIPSRMRLSIHAAERITRYEGIEMAAIDKAKWSMNFEVISNAEKVTLDGGYKRLSPPTLMFEFMFDGPIETLDQDIPLSGLHPSLQLTMQQTGLFNALILTVEFEYFNGVANNPKRNTTSHRDDQILKHSFDTNNAYSSSSSLLWIDAIDVAAGDVVLCEASHDSTRLRIRTMTPAVSPIQRRSVAVPRWQLDLMDDTCILNNWKHVLHDAVEEKLKEKIFRIDTRPDHSISTKSYNVEVLLLNSSLGYLSVESLRTAASVFALRKLKPCPNFHVTAIEASISQAVIARETPKANYHSIVEDCFTVSDAGLEWKSFSGAPTDKESHNDATDTCERKQPYMDTSTNSCQDDKAPSMLLSEDMIMTARSRLSTVAKDVRQVRPPTEDGMSKLALARLLQAPMAPTGGVDLPPAQPDDYLNDKADVVVNQLMDSGLLGEGILPILSYCHDALMKTNAKVIPYMARICAVGVYIGEKTNYRKDSHHLPFPQFGFPIRFDCWASLISGSVETALSMLGDPGGQQLDYVSYGYDPDNRLMHLMTDPVEVFEFKFDHLSARTTPSFNQTKSLSLKLVQEGAINGILFWYDLLLESYEDATRRGRNSPLTISSCPHGVVVASRKATASSLETQTETASSSSWPEVERSLYAQQALFPLPELLFRRDADVVPVVAAHTKCNITFHWDILRLKDIELKKSYSSQLLSDVRCIESWRRCLLHHSQILNQLSDVSQDPKTGRMIAEASTSIAVNPGRYRQFNIDPEQAAWFCLSFFY